MSRNQEKIKRPRDWNPQHKKWASCLALIVCVVILIAAIMPGGAQGEVTYRETAVEFGNLTVGITENGSVDIGTVEQVFELDMSALQRVETDTTGSQSGGGSMGGMAEGMGGGISGGFNMFDQIFNMAGTSNTGSTGSANNLTVAEVNVSVGQEISVGDVLYTLEEESVKELEEELESNVEKAKADLDAVYANQTLSRQTAQYTYDSSTAYGSYADTEYSSTIATLENAVAQAEKALAQAQESLEDYERQLAEITSAYEDALVILENCRWSAENTDKTNDTYNYTTRFQMMQNALSTVDNLEQQKERLEQNIEQAGENVKTAQQSYDGAQRSLAQGRLSAAQTLALRQLAYNTAQETYDIALAYLEEDAGEQETIYQETVEKWEEYSSHISDNAVLSQYNGIITGVNLNEGDSISTNTALVTLYDMDEVTVTVSVAEDDMRDIALGSMANISFTAYPDSVFKGEVTEISDASTDSAGNVTYEVTTTLQGDVSGLFQGMTGEITFITKESESVLYVSNRAVTREGTQSYVKVRNESGSIEIKEIRTGFSDGINVEILEGLSEGDIVLIESKVSES